MKRVKVGVIGAGTWGSVHARVYSSLPEVELVAICDINQEKARTLAVETGAKMVYSDYAELLQRSDISAVSVALPDFLHTEVVVAAAKRKKNILIEKPLATSLVDAKKCVEAIKKNKVICMVDFSLRWMSPFLKAKESIKTGQIGEPQFCYFEQSNVKKLPLTMLKWADKSNVGWFLGSHSVDMIRWLFNDEVRQVFSRSNRRVLVKQGIETEDFFISILELQNGGIAVIENTWILPDAHPSLGVCKCKIVGSEGSISIDILDNASLCVERGSCKIEYPNMFGLNYVNGKIEGSPRESISHFIQCIQTGSRPIVTEDDGLAAVKIIEAIQKSANTRKPVKIDISN